MFPTLKFNPHPIQMHAQMGKVLRSNQKAKRKWGEFVCVRLRGNEIFSILLFRLGHGWQLIGRLSAGWQQPVGPGRHKARRMVEGGRHSREAGSKNISPCFFPVLWPKMENCAAAAKPDGIIGEKPRQWHKFRRFLLISF